jgi:hypothetical protein
VRRRLLNLLTALSLLLCVAIVAMWVRSHVAADAVEWQRADDVGGAHYHWYRIIASGRGRVELAYDAEVSEIGSITPQEAARPVGRWQRTARKSARLRDLLRVSPDLEPAFGGPPSLPFGFHFAWATSPATVRREVIVPYWALVLVTGALPAFRLPALARRFMRPGAGLCPRCGYDLRATPDRCPECGAEAAASTAPLSAARSTS